jgi:hypothetical protein
MENFFQTSLKPYIDGITGVFKLDYKKPITTKEYAQPERKSRII